VYLLNNYYVAPSSGVGSNVFRSQNHKRTPRALCLGGDLSHEQQEWIIRTVESQVRLPAGVMWVRRFPECTQALGYSPYGKFVEVKEGGKRTMIPDPEAVATYWRYALQMAGTQ